MGGASVLECPVCYRHASAQDRVHTCANGHYCCADCMQRCSACPVCRDSTQVRNLIAEEMLASPTLQTICGSCGQWHRIGDVHHCAVFPRCPLGCGWSGFAGTHWHHLATQHCIPVHTAPRFTGKVTQFPFIVLVGSHPARLVRFAQRDEMHISISCCSVGHVGESSLRALVKLTSAKLNLSVILRACEFLDEAHALVLSKETVVFALENDTLSVTVDVSI